MWQCEILVKLQTKDLIKCLKVNLIMIQPFPTKIIKSEQIISNHFIKIDKILNLNLI
jgi:hypothetical protein